MKTQGQKYSGKGGILSEEDLKETDDDDFTDTDEVEFEEVVEKKGKGKRSSKRTTRYNTPPPLSYSKKTHYYYFHMICSTRSNYPTLDDPQYITNIRRKSKAWARRLSLLKRVRLEIERFDDINDFTLPENWLAGRRQNPTHWCVFIFFEIKLIVNISVFYSQLRNWGPTEDRDLLVGVYKHGFGCFEHIYDDENLCFKGRRMDDEVYLFLSLSLSSFSLFSHRSLLFLIYLFIYLDRR